MDPKLAEIYGTNQVSEADVEKLAAAELAEGLAGEGGLDLSAMSAEDVEALAQQVLNGDEGAAGGEEEASEKVAEADYLGRVMAHAYHQESKEIEKQAGLFGGGKKKEPKPSLVQRARGAVAKGARATHGHMGNVGRALTRGKLSGGKAKALGYGVYGAGALAAAGGAAAASKHGKKKHSSEASALDQLALARAQEILAENGVEAEQEKVAEGNEQYDVLAQAVEARAAEMLAEAGYTYETEQE